MQSFLRNPCSSNRIKNIGLKFVSIMRCRSGNRLRDLSPNELGWIELGSGYRKIKHMDPWVLRQKILHRFAFMDWVSVPYQYNRARHSPKNLSKESNHFLARQAIPVRAQAQADLPASGRNEQHSQQVETLMVINRSPHNRCLSTPRPATFKRRNHRKATFVFKSEGSAQSATLFLSSAALLPSIPGSHHHPVERVDAAGVGDSSPSDA